MYYFLKEIDHEDKRFRFAIKTNGVRDLFVI